MSITRRKALGLLAVSVPAIRIGQTVSKDAERPAILPGPFVGTRESLRAYQVPDWFRDANSGIWAHWGPQSAPEYGDWYARNMYMQGSRQYNYHVQRYGHPSKFGFKDVIQTWKGEKFAPEHLLSLYKKAGAKYFMSMGVHHDNFDLWNSKHTRWNSVKMGLKKDIVGLFRKAAREQGLKFAVSDHLWISYKWFSTSRGSDQEGPKAGIPYDGAVAKNADLYQDCPDVHSKLAWDETGIPEKWKRHWFERIKDLLDQYEPDLLYSDGHIPFGDWGLNLVAHFYNLSAKKNKGEVQVAYTSKRLQDSEAGACVLDVERGVVANIWPSPWQTDICIGHWHYDKEAKYKSPKAVIDLLVDIVSRNGTLMLNFPLPSSGMLDGEELKILDEITRWMAVNSEGFHGTRPWKIFGLGESQQRASQSGEAKFNERNRRELNSSDIRFTTKGQTLYTFLMGWPGKEAVVGPLGKNSPHAMGKIESVELLGRPGRLAWSQNESDLRVQLPAESPCDHAIALRISGARLT